jgi:hypothetical protein
MSERSMVNDEWKDGVCIDDEGGERMRSNG